MPTDLKTAYNHNIHFWKQYASRPEVRASSNPTHITECDAYERLVALGRPIFPFLLETFKDDDAPASTGLVLLVRDIAGDEFQIPREMQGQTARMKAYTLAWLAR